MKPAKHVVITQKENCCGCTACYAVCPLNAIEMVADEEGFQYPRVDEDKCVNCGLCVSCCPLIAGNRYVQTNSFYAVRHASEEVRAKSSSGGIFSAIAQNVVAHNGVVYGAAFDQTFAVRHVRTDKHTWEKLKTSKYVQSDMGDVYAQVKLDLKAGLPVLFTGTPCQVDGLNQYLKNTDTEKLITCDIVCHGVPSPKIWKEYLEQLKRKSRKEIQSINFRNKEGCGWHRPTIKIVGTDGTVLSDEPLDMCYYYLLFMGHAILRPSCFSCQYANLQRPGDISMGDYWGVEKHHPELDDDKGLSLVMANTKKGQSLIAQVAGDCMLVPVAKKECMQPNLQEPAQDYGDRSVFWRTYHKYGLEYAGRRMGLLKMGVWDKFVILGMRILDKLSRCLR